MRERMRLEIRELQKRLGITTVYVTHDQQEAMVIADRIVLMNAGRVEQMGAPRQLYERPVTQFAADFIGVANALGGIVHSIDGARTTVAVGNAMLECATQNDCRQGDAVDVIIRPEHVSVIPEHEGTANCLRGQVTDVIFLGSSTDIGIASGIGSLRAQISPPGVEVPGQEVRLKVNPAAIVLLRREPAVNKA